MTSHEIERLVSIHSPSDGMLLWSREQCCHDMTQVDESRMIAAAAGVRVMWVAVSARRQGIGSKLLDLARCAAA